MYFNQHPINKCLSVLPAQALPVLQVVLSTDSPTHERPPLLGAGESQTRLLVRPPVPHVAEQAVYDDHCPQLPLTKL